MAKDKLTPTAPPLDIRILAVDRAGAEFTDWLSRFQDKQGLTNIEVLQILGHAQTRLVTLELRTERET